MNKPQILIALGSPSDLKLFRNLIYDERDLELDERAEFYLSVASAHRTPDVVVAHSNMNWDAIIAGAGMTNALLSEYVKSAAPETLVFGLPINDSATGGLSSVLSSQELPPGYVSVCVKPEELCKAEMLAVELVSNQFTKVVVYDFNYALSIGSERGKKIFGLLEKLGVPYRAVINEPLSPAESHELPLALFGTSSDLFKHRGHLDDAVKHSFVIGTTTIDSKKNSDYDTYMNYFYMYPKLVVVGFDAPANLALFGAKVVSRSNPAVAKKIADYLEEGRKKYDEFKKIIPLTPEKVREFAEKYGKK